MHPAFAPSADPSAPPCDVFPACALRVHTGVNVGDDLGAVAASCAGDVYRLDTAARRIRVHLSGPGPDDLRRIGIGSDIGVAGDVVRIGACHVLMAVDGTRAEVLVLHSGAPGAGSVQQSLLMPLQPLCPGIDYTLIRSDAPPGPGRLPDLAFGAIARGTRIMLANGAPRPVEALRPGDMVLTRDHGAQMLRWAGLVTLRAIGAQAPVVIKRGVLGNAADLHLGQYSRLFLYRRSEPPTVDLSEALVQARHLLGDPGVSLREGGFVDYALLVFDRHEILYAEGIPVESLQVTDATMERLPGDIFNDLKARFAGLNQPPHFGTEAGRPRDRPARREGQAPVL